MRLYRVVAFLTVCVLLVLLLTPQRAFCQDYIEYKIHINPDDSAAWTITKVTDLNASIDVEGFQQKIETLIANAAISTQREMSLDVDSLQVSDEISWDTQSRTTVYMFTWLNFSTTQDGGMVFGDAFETAGFFSLLYGDGALQITYPPNYSVQSVSPPPNERDDSAHALKWFRTQDFINGKPNVTLTKTPETQNDNGWQQNIIIAGFASAIAIALPLVGFYMIKRRKSKAAANSKLAPLGISTLESDEDKIVRIIKSSGGSIHQSDITEQCKFSKAKTSQLLTALENKRVITRYKKGRDKIVTLNERAAGDKS